MAKPPEPSQEQSTSTQSVWGPQADALSGLYGNASDWYNQNTTGLQSASQQAGNLSTGAANAVAQPWLNNLQGGNLGGYDIAGSLGNSLTNSMSNPTLEQQAIGGFQNNNYSDAYRQNFLNEAQTAQSQMLQGLDARAAASGMSGGSAYGNAVAGGMRDINSNLQSNLSNIGYQDYNRMATAAQTAGQNADQTRLQQQAQLGDLTSQQQQSSQAAIAQQPEIQAFINGPLQSIMQSAGGLQMLQSLLGSPTALTEQQSTSNGATAQGGPNYSVGTSGVNLSG